MRRVTRLQAATAATALFVGGTIAAGIVFRPDVSTNAGATGSPEVIHKRMVKTISVPAGPPPVSARAVASGAPGTATPVSVSSRTSPGAGGPAGGYEREDEGEVEYGESD